MLCSSTKISEFDFPVVKSQLFTTPNQYLDFSIEKQYFRVLLLFFYYTLSEMEKVINVRFMTVGNLTNTNHLDYQAGVITLMLFNCWLSLRFWPILHTIFCAVPPCSCGFIITTLLKM